MTTETIEGIGNKIIARAGSEFSLAIPNKTIGYSSLTYNGEEIYVWLVNNEIKSSTIFAKDIHGDIDPKQSAQGASDILSAGGLVISKNSPFGGFLIIQRLGKHSFKQPNGANVPIETFSFAQYIEVEDFEGIDATYGLISLKEGETKFTSLRQLLKDINNLEVRREELQNELLEKEVTKAEGIALEIRQLEEEIKKEKEGLKRYINKNVELRYLPILSPEQETIKRSIAFKGTLIINGGPGTGKTTTLIQRIKYLISPDIIENEVELNLSQSDKTLLFDQRKSWIFFSPTELLKNYLKEAMTREGLEANDDKSFEWNDFLKRKIREYRLVNTETKRPFLFFNSETSYFNLGIGKTALLLKAFDEYYIIYNKTKFERLSKVDLKGKPWEKIGKEIIEYIDNSTKESDQASLMRLYYNLNEKFGSPANKINEDYKLLIDKAVSTLIVKIKSDTNLALWFEEELKKAKQIKNQSDEDEDEDDELEDENFEDIIEVVQHFNFDLELSRKLRTLYRKIALREFDENTKLTKRDKPFSDKINPLLNAVDLKDIGERALFKKYFERLTKGVEINLLREIPTIYKKFRRDKLRASGFLTSDGANDLETILNQKNLHLHKEELSLVLFKINSIIKEIYNSLATLYNSSSNPFIKVYRDSAKAIVAIDEATDFTAIDLACMSSFSHPRFNSVTLCGDIMQRIEATGILSWDEYTEINKESTTKFDLLVSFRQTPLLFDLARKLYVQSTGLEPEFSSYQTTDENDPKPLLLINSSKEKTAKWIGDRIIEIHNRYNGNTPSIAVFVADEVDISPITILINEHEELQNFGIKAIECPQGKVLGSASNIRVYSVKYIKGLEFEAVFFIDTDKIQNNNSELVDRYLYVGLSRATYFLALTANIELPKKLEVIKRELIENGNWTMI